MRLKRRPKSGDSLHKSARLSLVNMEIYDNIEIPAAAKVPVCNVFVLFMIVDALGLGETTVDSY